MKVVLLEKYKKLGQIGEVIDVKKGFARNYLIPNGKAALATESNVAQFESRKAELLEESKKKEEAAQKLDKKIRGKIVNVIKQAGDDGRLYGAVNAAEIATGLNNLGFEITRKQVTLNYSIKFIGVYAIETDLGEGVLSEIYLNVARSEGEAVENAKKFKSGEIRLTTANSDANSRLNDEMPVAPAKQEETSADAESASNENASTETAAEEQSA